MGNRTGIYVMFHAGGTTDPTASDIKYYNTLKMWDSHKHHDFSFTNSHDKTNAVRDSSKRETLRKALVTRLNVSKSVLLIATETTRNDTDWVPFELEYAIEKCGLPIIIAYPDHGAITNNIPRQFWPDKLQEHVRADTVKTLNIPFLQKPITDALDSFSVQNPPKYTVTTYTEAKYREWGLLR